MKNVALVVIALLVGFGVGYYLFGCSMKKSDKPVTDTVSSSPSAERNLFNKASPFDKLVCTVNADGCVADFVKIYSNSGFNYNDLKKLKTTNINFGSKNLIQWLNDVDKNSDADSIKIKLGIYNQAFITAYSSDFPGQDAARKLGRLTAFLYATRWDAQKNKSVKAIYTQASSLPRANCASSAPTANAVGDTTQAFNFAGIEP